MYNIYYSIFYITLLHRINIIIVYIIIYQTPAIISNDLRCPDKSLKDSFLTTGLFSGAGVCDHPTHRASLLARLPPGTRGKQVVRRPLVN